MFSGTGHNRIIVGGFDLSNTQIDKVCSDKEQTVLVFTDTTHGLTFEWNSLWHNLRVTGPALDDSANPSGPNSITINLDLNSNLSDLAQLQESFGIHLDPALDFEAALVIDNLNPFKDPNYVLADGSATIREQGGQRLNLALNQSLKAGDTITLQVESSSGLSPEIFVTYSHALYGSYTSSNRFDAISKPYDGLPGADTSPHLLDGGAGDDFLSGDNRICFSHDWINSYGIAA